MWIRPPPERLAKALVSGYSDSLAPIRTVCTTVDSLPVPPPKDPLIMVGEWLDEALREACQRHPNAMTLATVDTASKPSARVVLIKELARIEGYATFYGHYQSRKGLELERNANAAGVLHWDKLGRQIRFEGPVVRAPEEESDAYFATRPTGSQLNAWVSEQSRPLENIEELARREREKAHDLGLAEERDDGAAPQNGVRVPRPPFWGGYRFWFAAVELWLEGEDRFHGRLRYERALTPKGAFAFATTPWTCQRLQP
jgi:pyridoxamine 5'-phosphate oxidase